MSAAVTIDYNALKSHPSSLETDFRAAFGNDNDALGAIIIKSQSSLRSFPTGTSQLTLLTVSFSAA